MQVSCTSLAALLAPSSNQAMSSSEGKNLMFYEIAKLHNLPVVLQNLVMVILLAPALSYAHKYFTICNLLSNHPITYLF